MNTFKKGLSLLLGTVIATGVVGSLNVEAFGDVENIPLTAPEGYIESMVNREYGIIRYQDTSDMFKMLRYSNFRYNCVEITLNEGYDWETVYSQYSSDLEFDYADGQDSLMFMYDNYVIGDDPRTRESVPDKYTAIKEMCAQMYADGVIASADYSSMKAGYDTERYNKQIYIADFSGTEEELQEIVGKYTEYGSAGITGIAINEPHPEDYPDEELDLLTYDELVSMRDEIDALYEGDTISLISEMPTEESAEVSTTPINLLTAIIEESSCDLNQSGAPDLDDAVLLLSHYANTAAGIETAAETDTVSYDVNGDGSVNLDDAVKILTVYAELAAGLR